MIKTFYETKSLFTNYIDYIKPLSYSEWLALADDHKAAALYVQFFNEIMLAWNKAKSYDGDDEEAVETVIQYLIKNTEIIKQNPSRFSPKYIYRVAYNCLYCICHDRLCDKNRREYEIYAIQTDSSGDEYSLFDIYSDSNCTVDHELYKKTFWRIIENLDIDSSELIDIILNTGKLPENMSDEHNKILEQLRSKLSGFIGILY